MDDCGVFYRSASKVPEFCGRLDEEQVSDKAFELIFAFDEVIAVGYKEKVTLQQIKTFLEMDSQEEKIHEMLEKALCICPPLPTPPLDSMNPFTAEQRARSQGRGSAPEEADRKHEEWHGRNWRHGRRPMGR